MGRAGRQRRRLGFSVRYCGDQKRLSRGDQDFKLLADSSEAVVHNSRSTTLDQWGGGIPWDTLQLEDLPGERSAGHVHGNWVVCLRLLRIHLSINDSQLCTTIAPSIPIPAPTTSRLPSAERLRTLKGVDMDMN